MIKKKVKPKINFKREENKYDYETINKVILET